VYTKLNNYDVTLETLNTLVSKIDDLKISVANKKCFLGFDGYVDSLYSMVKSRKNAKTWEKMESLKEFGNLISKVAGSSANAERVLKKKIFGGFAPNTSRALNSLGVKIYLVAALGYPKFNEYYQQSSGVESISIGNPGETIGLEFDDGKLMITDFEPILNIDWNLLRERVKSEKLIEIMHGSDIMGFGHWALVPNLNDIWNHFLHDLFPSISNLKNKLFFVDIADITKRSPKDILEMIEILQKINRQIPVMLSVNDREAIRLSVVLNKTKVTQKANKDYREFATTGKEINNNINLSYFVIHSPHFATISTDKDHYWVTEGFTLKPNYTVAAGDHFHSGVVLGLSCNLTPPEAILMGNALTAIFVRTGISPNFEQLTQFINRYLEYILNENPYFP
jgi:sugar/nucleoside kinase (ribokinase family)